MKSVGLRGIIRMGFFWKKQPEKHRLDVLMEEEKNSPRLSYLIDNIKKLNESKPKILPPQLPEHKGKLTVVM